MNPLLVALTSSLKGTIVIQGVLSANSLTSNTYLARSVILDSSAAAGGLRRRHLKKIISRRARVGRAGIARHGEVSRRSDAYETLTEPLQFAYIPREDR